MHKLHKNMFLYCGLVANKLVQKQFITTPSFTHNQPLASFLILINLLCTLFTQLKHRVLHTFFIQFTSVNGLLFTQSTGPTITTTYKLISNGEVI